MQFVDDGAHQLKNIQRRLRVYRVNLRGATHTARPALSVPDRTSIAVLPFDNLDDASEDIYFADGVAEDIITELSRYPDPLCRRAQFLFHVSPQSGSC